MIHSTAIVDAGARLPESVEIGPRVLIEGEVELGEGCIIQANAVLLGPLKMGAANTVGYGAVIGALPQDLGFDPATPTSVEIGDHNVIRELATIHRATKPDHATRVGSRNYLMAGAHLGHDVQIGDRCIIANNVLVGGHVHFGDAVVVGGGTVFHQFIRVGSYAMLRGNSGYGKDVTPYTIGLEINRVGGLNVIGMRRAGLSAEVRKEIKRAFQLLYTSGKNVSQALEAAAGEKWGTEAQYFWEFVRSSKRGLCRLSQSREEE